MDSFLKHIIRARRCTSLGHNDADADPVDPALLVPPLLCCEVIHTPAETRFLARARVAWPRGLASVSDAAPR